MKFQAVAFDLDGTLYPNYRANLRLIPFILKENRLLRALGSARTQIRKSYELVEPGSSGEEAGVPDAKNSGAFFYENQARIMGEILGEAPDKIKEKIERLIYRGWEPLFNRIELFAHVKETLNAFRNSGLKLGLLSDFPPEVKLENLKISGYWDTVLCSEETGYIKPHPASFMELASRLETKTEHILYVGNSVSYDVYGAGRVGMKTALIRSELKRLISAINSAPKGPQANFFFSDYRQLCDYVLN